MSETGLIRAYTGLTRVLAPVLPFWLKRRALKGKEDPTRQGERFGRASKPRPAGQLFWMHGASVGEVTMLLPLIERVLTQYPAAHVLVTSGTVTSAGLLDNRLPDRAFHQYVPLDTPKAVKAFLDHWRPDAAIWAESEIWPNLIRQTKVRGVPMALINARMSDKSIQGWFKRQESAKAIFGCFDLILAANEDTANGLAWLLGKAVQSGGNLKDAASALPVNRVELAKLQTQITDRPIWCAASTHRGEEALILAAHEEVRKTHPRAMLVLALRHPERRDQVLPMLAQTHTAIRSRGDVPRAKTSVYMFDTIGEMGLAYTLSDITFVCGSLVEGLMGHNPLEPAQFSNAVLTGAHISSFADSYREMIAFDAAARILSPTMIGPSVSELFSNPEVLANRQAQALAFAQSRDAVLDYVWVQLSPILPRPQLSELAP
ncbi:3-deoxy-D-manno-octulosonic acid transferase [Litorimonas sp. RW-G-Af-16]|uniref:3-deoxy-D-manno-octulosonic acid transferase n=1 Tax=Litorimonas sp. RW-G-Af-16 TaxID=3241168 RepID=UPI00390C524E